MIGLTRRQAIASASLLAGAWVGARATPAHAADDALARVRQSGVLKIGTETQFAPFDFLENGRATGLNYEVFEQIAKEMKLKTSFVALPWESVLPGLDAGKFDMVAGPATITKARMERYRFLPPIADATVALMKRAGDKTIAKPEDIAGKVVGSAKATAQLAQLQKYAATLGKAPTIREYVDFSQAYADLAAGRIVAVANSLPNLADAVAKQKDKFALVQPPFGDKSYFGYLGRKDPDYASLMDALDVALLAVKADGRLAKLQTKWFGTTFDTPDKVTTPSV